MFSIFLYHKAGSLNTLQKSSTETLKGLSRIPPAISLDTNASQKFQDSFWISKLCLLSTNNCFKETFCPIYIKTKIILGQIGSCNSLFENLVLIFNKWLSYKSMYFICGIYWNLYTLWLWKSNKNKSLKALKLHFY